jgi:hypothetical protein
MNLRNTLQAYLSHYKVVLADHEIALPVSEVFRLAAEISVLVGNRASCEFGASRMIGGTPNKRTVYGFLRTSWPRADVVA